MSKEIAKAYWNHMQNQNFTALQELFAPNAIIDWPNTSETFTVEEFIYINQVYPGNWKEEIRSIHETADGCVCECWVGNEEISFYAISFLQIENGKIYYLREFWSMNDTPPEWRLAIK